jgi:uncharacterized membrane protein
MNKTVPKTIIILLISGLSIIGGVIWIISTWKEISSISSFDIFGIFLLVMPSNILISIGIVLPIVYFNEQEGIFSISKEKIL